MIKLNYDKLINISIKFLYLLMLEFTSNDYFVPAIFKHN